MNLGRIKPVGFLSENAADILADFDRGGAPLVITHDGEAKAVLQSARDYERTQETLALLTIIAMAERNIAEGKTRPAREVIEEIRAELRARRSAA